MSTSARRRLDAAGAPTTTRAVTGPARDSGGTGSGV